MKTKSKCSCVLGKYIIVYFKSVLPLLFLTIGIINNVLSQTNIVFWNFEDQNRIADGGVTANLSKIVSRDSLYTGTYPFYTGAGGGKCISSLGWANGENSKYWSIEFSTSGYKTLALSSKQYSTDQAPRDFKIQYSLDSTLTWNDVPNSTVVLAKNFTSGVLTNLLLPTACNNQPSVFLRWIMSSNIAVIDTLPLASGSNSRIDDIVISGYLDTIAPTIVNVHTTSISMVKVVFNEPVNSTCENTLNYTGLGSISSAVHSATDNTVTLTLATPLSSWGSYTLCISNVQDIFGNAIQNPYYFSILYSNLVSWNFEDQNRIADVGIPDNLSKIILRDGLYSGNYPFYTGVEGGINLGSSGWTNGADSKYWIIEFSTYGYYSLTLSSKQYSSNQAPRDFKVQYSVNSTIWTDIPNSTLVLSNNTNSGTISNLTLPVLCENQHSISIRWIMNSNTAVVDTLPITSLGNSRIDDIVISGFTSGYFVNGVLKYNNSSNTLLSGLNVNLMNGSTQVATNTTNSTGNFTFFNVPDGSFTITATTTNPWSGVTATDALKLKRHIAGLELLTEPIRLSASDVNNSNSITATDVLKVQRRIANLDLSFVRPDWNFEKPIIGGNNIVVNGANVTQNLYALCTGDVNGSYIPTLVKQNYNYVTLQNDSRKNIDANQEFDLPVKVANPLELGAFQLFLNYNSNIFDVIDVTLSNPYEDLIYNVQDGIIKIVWANINPISLNTNDVLLKLRMKAKNTTSLNTDISLNDESELSNSIGNIIENTKLSIPAIAFNDVNSLAQNNSDNFEFSIYPNPVKNELTIKTNFVAKQKCEILNILGEVVYTLTVYKTITFNTSQLKSGVYFVKVYTDKLPMIKRFIKD